MSEKINYGIWDVKDRSWMGKETGPLCYTDHYTARVAATILTEQFAFERTFAVRALPPDPFTEKDTIDAKFDGETAIRRIEAKA